MLTRLDVKNAAGNVLALPFFDISSGYLVKEIDGLDPVTAILASSPTAQVDGAQFQSARRDPRNIIIKLGFQPDYSMTNIASLRAALYAYLMPKSAITMSFYQDGILAAITTGVVESFQVNMFSQDPEVDISVLCYDPDFYAPALTTLNLNTTSTLVNTPITYPGNSDAGIVLAMSVNRTISGFTLQNTRPDGTQTFNVVASLVTGDLVTISSLPGAKSVVLTRGGIPVSSANFIGPGSSWITLTNGVNQFRASLAGSVIPYTLKYTPKYGGL